MSTYKLPALGMRPVFTPLTQSSIPISESPKKVEPKANPVNLLLPLVGPVLTHTGPVLTHAVNYVPVVVAGKPFPVAYPVVVSVAHPVMVVGSQPKMIVVDPLVRLAPHLVRF